MILAATPGSVLDQLPWLLWTRVLPVAVLATIAGLVLRYLVEWVTIAVARRWLAFIKLRPPAIAPDNVVASVPAAVPV